MANFNELLKSMYQTTADILDFASKEDVEQLSLCIEKRKKTINELSPMLKQVTIAPEDQKIMDSIIELDKRANEAVSKLTQYYKENVKVANTKFNGLLKYKSIKYDLSSGQLYDKKK